ncbi:MAG: tRNA lysidine(34) synthetase TilS [Lachnospiraceae bacterium]|nr:tRNA lysidine(34) synthetase TilS [Lachnospiraceae bacterium]
MLIDKAALFMKQHKMLKMGDRVAVGVSGGADSVCLLKMLCERRKADGIFVEAIHIHHGIRGQAADEDETFVDKLCRRLEVPVRFVHADVPAEAACRHLSEEEAGRQIRYASFENVMAQDNLNVLALAHQMNDVAETLLHNEARGTALAGLASLRPVRDAVIRPLLCVTREEIEQYLTAEGETWREDETNHEDEHTRNRIRHHILPALTDLVNEQALRHLYELSCQAAEVTDYIRTEAEAKARDYVKKTPTGEALIDKSMLRQVPAFMCREILLMTAGEVLGSRQDLGRLQADILMELLSGASGRKRDLVHGLEARMEDTRLRLMRKPALSDKADATAISGTTASRSFFGNAKTTALSAENDTPGAPASIADHAEKAAVSHRLIISEGESVAEPMRVGKWLISAEIQPSVALPVPEKAYTKWLDYDKIKRILVLRHRQSGDQLTVNAEGGRKSLKKWFIDEKVPREERDDLWLLADGDEIVWIIGHRIGATYKVTPETKRVLKVTVMSAEDSMPQTITPSTGSQ